MARNKKVQALEIASNPKWETHVVDTYPDGRIRCVPDRSVWLCREIPQASITNAKTVQAGVEVGDPLDAALRELAGLVNNPVRRVVSKNNYREIHLLWINVPKLFTAHIENPIAEYLNAQFGGVTTYERKAILAVKLLFSNGTGKGNLRERASSAIDSFLEAVLEKKGAPITDYDRDAAQVSMAMARAGLSIPDPVTLSFADAWFNHGKAASVATLPHEDHIHFFRSPRDGHRARSASPQDCTLWPDDVSEHALTFAAVRKFTLPQGVSGASSLIRWMLNLAQENKGTRCVSIRGHVEPGKLTRLELASQRGKYEADLKELLNSQKLTQAEFDQQLQDLQRVEDEYANDPPPTLYDAGILIAFSGVIDDITTVEPPGVELSPMMNKQSDAFASMKLGSPVRANPHPLEPTGALIAYSGISALSTGGDSPRESALVGFSEDDRQPVYISPKASFSEDGAPLLGCYSDTGAGKTVLLQSIASAFHKMRIPQLIVNPKPRSTMKSTLVNYGAHHMTLDDLEGTGLLDPFNSFDSPVEAASNAYSMLDAVNPFGGADQWNEYSTGIYSTLRAGALEGAKSTGDALVIGNQLKKQLPSEAIEKIFAAAEASPLFGASFAIEPTKDKFRLGDGTLLVEVGSSSFRLPPKTGEQVKYNTNLEIRASVNLLRTLVWAGASQLAHRGGVIHLDESWILEKADPQVLDEIGRLMRSWAVNLWLYTQRPSAHLEMGLKGYLSRGLIGHLKSKIEARSALDLFGYDNEELVDRITASAYIADGKVLNPLALHAQYRTDEQGNRESTRGSVFYYIDLKNRAVPTEIKLSEEFLYMASSTPEVVARREAEQARLEEANRDVAA